MPNAPAGWYADPAAPGSTRYWTGEAWLAPGAGPAGAAPSFAPQPTGFAPQPTGFAPQPTGFAPQPTGFAPQPTGFAPQPEYRPAPVVTDSHEQVRPVANQYLQPQVAEHPPVAQEAPVTWDVVGVPRASDVGGASQAPEAAWQGAGAPSYGRAGDPGAYAPSFYASQQPLPPYGSSALGRKRRSGWNRVAAVIVIAVVGFGVRWGFGQVFGADYSSDGRIEVATPKSWTVHSVNSPDMTYAVNDGWQDVTRAVNSQLAAPDTTILDARLLATDFSGNQALMVLQIANDQFGGQKASREDYENGFDRMLDRLDASGKTVTSREKVTVLKSTAGDRWGFMSAQLSVKGVTVTVYDAVTIIDDYIVEVELIVPEGVELTENDLLAVANSVAAS